MENWFFVLAAVLAIAAVAGAIARWAKQPPLLGYIAAGVIFSFTGAGKTPEIKLFLDGMGQVGITLLLFLAGLELPISELKKTGKISLILGLSQVSITSCLGFGIARLLGFDPVSAIYLGIGLAFGSTILVVKLLSEKGDLQSLHGKISLGLLLVQDFVAIGLMLVAGSSAGKTFAWENYALILAKSIVLVGVAVWLSEKVMGKIMGILGKSTELVFVGALGWCLLVAAVVSLPIVGFTREIGGFLAGLALAGAMEQAQIISRVRPLRDFFITWFFVNMGTSLALDKIGSLWMPAAIFSAYVLIVNPLIVMAILSRLGYRKRTSFLTGLAVTQVSEFSLILLTRAGLNSETITTITLVMMFTMMASTYLIWNSGLIYKKISKYLKVFERKNLQEQAQDKPLSNHAILFGHNRVGSVISPTLEKMGMPVVVVDFNPQIIEKLVEQGKIAIYGDIADHELYERLDMDKAKVIISTVPDFSDNWELLGEIKMSPKKRPFVILTANDQEDAERLYRAGADYVLVPHSVGGEYLADYLRHHYHD